MHHKITRLDHLPILVVQLGELHLELNSVFIFLVNLNHSSLCNKRSIITVSLDNFLVIRIITVLLTLVVVEVRVIVHFIVHYLSDFAADFRVVSLLVLNYLFFKESNLFYFHVFLHLSLEVCLIKGFCKSTFQVSSALIRWKHKGPRWHLVAVCLALSDPHEHSLALTQAVVECWFLLDLDSCVGNLLREVTHVEHKFLCRVVFHLVDAKEAVDGHWVVPIIVSIIDKQISLDLDNSLTDQKLNLVKGNFIL